MGELLTLIEDLTRTKAVRVYKPLPQGDFRLTWANIARAERLLGFRPRVEFREGLARFIDWYRGRD